MTGISPGVNVDVHVIGAVEKPASSINGPSTTHTDANGHDAEHHSRPASVFSVCQVSWRNLLLLVSYAAAPSLLVPRGSLSEDTHVLFL